MSVATTPPAAPAGVMGCRSREIRALAETARRGTSSVIIDQAEDLRRRLLEQETLVRAEADLEGVSAVRVEAALTSTRAAAHVLETISTSVAGELEQQRWVASQVVRFAGRLIDSAQAQLHAADMGRAVAPSPRPMLRVGRGPASSTS